MNRRGLILKDFSFGAVSLDDLFSEKEQPLFDLYERSKARYSRALDIGANVGVHTLLMVRNGWEVRSFEPDPIHFGLLMDNCILNGASPTWMMCQAVSDHDGEETFIRVNGNTTGSHLKGDKEPYGKLDEFKVEVTNCRPLFDWADFAKIDCEGHEARILLTTTPEQMEHLDIVCEVGSLKNADAIYEHFSRMGVSMYAQKNDWDEVRLGWHVPKHHSEGALFISSRGGPWR